MGIAQSMFGDEYEIEDVVLKVNNAIVLADVLKIIQQPITVTENIRKGQLWRDPIEWRGGLASNVEFDIHGFRQWRITSIKDEEDHKIIKFKMIEPEKLEEKKSAKYKELLQSIDLSEEHLKQMIKEMLINVFTKATLEKLLTEERIEFILDKYWIYIKAGKTAYRV